MTVKNEKVSFADVVQDRLVFDPSLPHHALVLKLIDSTWMQRLRDISQTANTRMLYMFSEHSRFGHSLGVAHLACQLIDQLIKNHKAQVEPYAAAIAAAALLHDVGHLAPGSHSAQKIWFPHKPDQHEETSIRIILGDTDINHILKAYDPNIPVLIANILAEDSTLPLWTWEIISGGGWNVDRGNWCMLDSQMAGVSYGKYNIPALTDSISITPSGHLALRENRLDAMMHFAVSRHAMYRQVYQHRVLLATDVLSTALISKIRNLNEFSIIYHDEIMLSTLKAESQLDLNLDEIFWIRESWWRYHLARWTTCSDKTIADISRRLLFRDLLKTIKIQPNDDSEELFNKAKELCLELGFDPTYYVHLISTKDVNVGDSKRSMLVIRDNHEEVPLSKAEPLFNKMLEISKTKKEQWLAVPSVVKDKLGRKR